jgi:DNA repair exonuclease SbcCD nuclease subunit
MKSNCSKILFVGDPHFRHTQKEEMDSLMGFVHDIAYKNRVHKIVILGDLNDNHGILRTDNQVFWEKWLKALSDHQELVVLIGNHDMKNQGNDDEMENSLSIYNLMNKEGLIIVQSPVAFGPFAYMPYVHDKKRFVEQANALSEQGAKILICHGEFQGAAYDNGFFIKDGIEQENINFDLIISGHIHTRSTIGKIHYIGSPRWMTASDANKEKGLWLAEFDSEGKIVQEEFLDTSHVCTPIYAYQFKEGEAEPQIPAGSRASVELIGSSEWVSKQKVKFKGLASISSKITDKAMPNNRKTGNNLEHFIDKVFEPIQGIKKERMVEFMKELGVL